jgi:hypothetical protein
LYAATETRKEGKVDEDLHPTVEADDEEVFTLPHIFCMDSAQILRTP